MIRRMLRLGVRLGLLTGIGFALFKLVQGRRAADFGSPSADWAPAPAPAVNPNLPKVAPEPPLVEPVLLEAALERKPPPAPAPEVTSPVAAATGESVVKKAAPAKGAAKKSVDAAPPAGAAPVAPVKKAPAPKKAAAKTVPPAVQDARDLAAAKKAAPAKKAPKKTQ